MGEIIQIHVGQAGVQIANACWELYCLEHGIRADGTLCECPCDETFRNFFSFKDENKVVPRTVLVDSEPTVIDQVRTGPYGCLYNPGSLITGKEDSGSNFARGYYTMGAELIDITMEAIRMVAESCCNLRGFLIFRSVGGGTGSGLGNLIIEQLNNDYDRVSKVEFVIFPSPSISPLIVEPYNALLATHLGMDSIECTFILDNEALYDICAAKLNICSPRYKNLNRIIGQTASTFTTSQRFASDSSMSFAEFQTNLVPYPRIHFPVVSYAPFIAGTGSAYTNLSTEQITNACFEPCSQLVRCNPVEGKYMSCVLLYRGQVTSSYINSSICHLRNSGTIRFVDWQPTGFKVGLSSEPPYTVPCGGLSNSNKALLTLSNNTIIQKAWCRLVAKFDRLYDRRAFVHHYLGEGLEEDTFREASEDICTLISDYKEVDDGSCSPPCGGNMNAHDRCPDDSECGTGGPRVRPKMASEATSSRPDRNANNYGDKGDDSSISPGFESLNHPFSEDESPKQCPKCECSILHGTPCAHGCIKLRSGSTKVSAKTTTTESRYSSEEEIGVSEPGLQLPNREQEPVGSSRLKKSRSFQNAFDSPKQSQRRSRSHEPRNCEGDAYVQSPRPRHYKNFNQGFDTEAVRAKTRFCGSCCLRRGPRSRSCSRTRGPACGNRCCPGEVLRLPPPRPEGKETLGEALSAKERFCNSTCQPQRCEPIDCGCCNGAACKYCCDPCEPSCCCQVADPCLDPCPKRSCCFARDPCIYPFCCNDCDEPNLPCCSPCNSPCNNPCNTPCNPCNTPCNPCNTPCNPCNTPCNPCNPCNPCCSPCCEDLVKPYCYNACDVPKPPWCCRKDCCNDCEDPCCSPCNNPCCSPCSNTCCSPCNNTCCSPCNKTCCSPCNSPCCSPCDKPCCSPCSKPCCARKPCCDHLLCSNLVKPNCDDECDECDVPRCPRLRCEFSCTQKITTECCSKSPSCSPCSTPCCSPCSTPCCTPCSNSCSTPCSTPCCSPCSNPCGTPCSKPCCSPCSTPCCSPCSNPCGTPCSNPCSNLCSNPCSNRCSSPCNSPCCSPCNSPCNSPCDTPYCTCCENVFCANLVNPYCCDECELPQPPCCCPKDPCCSPCCNEPCCTALCPCKDTCCKPYCCNECDGPKALCCSTCTTPCCTPCCTRKDCCVDSYCKPCCKPCCGDECGCPQKVNWVIRPPRCRPKPRRPQCFCCLATDDTMYCNSDYCLPPVCCIPRRCQRPHPLRCFCNDEICGIFNASSAVLVAPRRCTSFCCYQEEEVVWCPHDNRICECFPESRTVFRPRMRTCSRSCSRSRSRSRSRSQSQSRSTADPDADLRAKARFPGQTV